MQELFVKTRYDTFKKLCLYGHFIGYNSSKAMKHDRESICTLGRFDFITDV